MVEKRGRKISEVREGIEEGRKAEGEEEKSPQVCLRQWKIQINICMCVVQ